MSRKTQALFVLYAPDKNHMVEAVLPNTLERMQQAVGGYIEVYNNGDGTVTVCNEEGRINGMAPNRRIGRELFFGPIFVCGIDGENFRSLTEPEYETYKGIFAKGA